MFRALWHAGVFWLFFPLVLPQALWLRRTTQTLPGAPGPGLGQTGTPVNYRLLGLGDSIIDGVGIPHRQQALTAQLAHHAGSRLNTGVSWHAVGRSGYTTGKVAGRLLEDLTPNPYHWIVISVGVNDVTGLVSLRQFLGDLERLHRALAEHSPDAAVILLGVPPMWHFPRLPQPLRWVIGQRARAFQAAGQSAASRLGWHFFANNFVPEPEEFARDGYHPNADSVDRWAEEIAAVLPVPRQE